MEGEQALLDIILYLKKIIQDEFFFPPHAMFRQTPAEDDKILTLFWEAQGVQCSVRTRVDSGGDCRCCCVVFLPRNVILT